MTNNHEIKLANVGELVLVSGCEKPVPTRNFRILQAEKETKTDMMNPVMQRCSCREYAETAVPEELLRQLAAAGMQAPSAKNSSTASVYRPAAISLLRNRFSPSMISRHSCRFSST